MKEQDKTSDNELSEVEINNISKNEFKVMIIKVLNELGEKMVKQNFQKDIENIEKNQTELKNTTKIKIRRNQP